MVSERNKKEMEEEKEKHIYPRPFLVTVQYNIKLFEENQIKYTLPPFYFRYSKTC